jgi:hypothetical protein
VDSDDIDIMMDWWEHLQNILDHVEVTLQHQMYAKNYYQFFMPIRLYNPAKIPALSSQGSAQSKMRAFILCRILET